VDRIDNEDITMKTSSRSLRLLTIGLVAFALGVMAPPVARAGLDGSGPMLCAINTIMECDGSGECHRHSGLQHPDFPSFLRINVGQGLITDQNNSNRKTEIKASARLDGRLILHGGENGRAWSAAIAEDTGRMSAGIVASDFTFALFGACTTP
jgi:hypothetical protein